MLRLRSIPCAWLLALLCAAGAARANVAAEFTEIMYHPSSTSPDLEWLELHNQMAYDLDISLWRLRGGVEFDFPAGTIIPGNGYLVVAKAPAALAAASGCTNVCGPFDGQLDNGGEKLQLFNNSGRVMDELSYEDGGDWPVAPDGSGASLAKRSPDTASASAASWTWSTQAGGTPGARNFPSTAGPARSTLLAAGSEWRFDDSGSDRATDWRQAAYPDSGWSTGRAVFAASGGILSGSIPAADRLVQRHRAADLAGYLDGQAVSAWADTATADGRAQNTIAEGNPTYHAGAVNGRPAVRFDGDTDLFRASLAPGIGASSGFAYFLVLKGTQAPESGSVGDGSGDYMLDRDIRVTGNPLVSLKAVAGAVFGLQVRYDDGGGLGGPVSATAVSGSSFHIVVLRRNRAASRFEIWVDGRCEGTSADGGGSLTPQPVSIGCHGSYPGGGFRGEIAEVAIYADPLTDEELQAVGSFLAQEYGLATSFAGRLARTRVSPSAPTVYFRSRFFFPENPTGAALDLSLAAQDGAVAYLNGQELWRTNMPSGPVAFATPALSAPPALPALRATSVPAQALQKGTNVLAVEVHRAAGATNLAFDAELQATVSPVDPNAAPGWAINEMAGTAESAFWIELARLPGGDANPGSLTLSAAGDPLRTCRLPDGAVPAGGFYLLTEAQLGFRPAPDEPVFLLESSGAAVLDARAAKNHPHGRAPDGRWLHPCEPTPGADNRFALRDELVLNEILYHARPQYDPYAESAEAWVELFNRGTSRVDLAGWKLSGGIGYAFPAGSAVEAGAYLVVAADTNQMLAAYPALRGAVYGPFSGTLSHGSDRIRLEDPAGNPADELTYYDGGRWPAEADGFGASLELRDPRADNAVAESWAASDEGARASWQTYTIRGTAAASTCGPDGAWNEFVLGLLDAGEVLLDDIHVIEDPAGARLELLQNGAFTADAPGAGASAWRTIGTHRRSAVAVDPDNAANRVMRLVASDCTEHMHNHAETTLAGNRAIVNGREYEISFRAKWVRGCNLLHSRLYFNRLARATRLAVPARGGTPGACNSRRAANIGPTCRALRHEPAVPDAGQAVTVWAALDDPDGVAAVTNWYAVNGGDWTGVAMAHQGGGRYSAAIPGQAASAVVQFYVESRDGPGAVSTFPAAGRNSRALVRFNDGLAAVNGRHNLRIVMTPADAAWMRAQTNVMSNDPIGATVVYDEREVFYDAGVRLKGSERHRLPDTEVGFHVDFQPEHRLRGVHRSVAIDRSEGIGFGQREMTTRLVQNRAGGQISWYSDLIKVITPLPQNTSSAELQLSRYGAETFDDQFADGGDGNVYKHEYVYYPVSTDSGSVEGRKLPQPDGVVGAGLADYGSDKESYRWTLILENHLEGDDYARLISFSKVMGLANPAFNQQAGACIDVDEWLRSLAIATVSGAGDQFGMGDGHNGKFYVRPSDQRVLYLPFDMDAFYDAGRPLVGNPYLQKLIADPGNERLYCGHMLDILNTAYNTAYLNRWLAQLTALSTEENFTAFASFIDSRRSFLLSQIAARATSSPFAITTPDGAVPGDTVVLAGTGGIDVYRVYLEGRPDPLTLAWSKTGTAFQWQTTVPLNPGVNRLTLEAFGFQGGLVATDTVTVTSLAPANPLSRNLRVSELMYDPPEGSSCEFLELCNTGTNVLDLSGVFLSGGVDFRFAGSRVTRLAPGAFVVVAANVAAFAARYATNGMAVAGAYSGKLDNAGEGLLVQGPNNRILVEFEYGNGRGWPLAASGAGHSLVPEPSAVAAEDGGSLDYGGNWRASAGIGGSPGRADPEPVRDVTLNEIMAHTDYADPARPEYDSNDWIELYNASAAPCGLADWYLSDDAANLRKWPIPAACTIGAGSWLSFDEVSGFHTPLTAGFGLNKAGESVFLSYLPGDSRDRVADCVAFRGQENGASLGRYPDGAESWLATVPTRDSANALAAAHPVITRIMYHPPDYAAWSNDSTVAEYVEIRNPSAAPVALWNETGAWRLDGQVQLTFPAGLALAPGASLLAVSFPPSDAARARVLVDVYGPTGALQCVVGPWAGHLDNGGGRVALERPLAPDLPEDPVAWVVVDEVVYSDRAPWPTEADGTGRPLVRLSDRADGSDPANWKAGLRLLWPRLLWPLDEGGGATASDASGHGFAGSLTDVLPGNADGFAPPAWTVGRAGSALVFDGRDDAVRAAQQVVSGYPFTLCAWVATADAAREGCAVYIGTSEALYAYHAIGVRAGRAEIAAHVSDNVRVRRSATGQRAIADDAWHHLAGVFIDATNKLLYVDGALDARLTLSTLLTGRVAVCAAGLCDRAAPDRPWLGRIEDVRVYGLALSEAEIAGVMAETAPRRDADGDGLPDAWETHYFGGTGAPQGDAAADWDGDGMPNEAEYQAGTDPTNRNDVFRLESGGGGIGFRARTAEGEAYSGVERRYSLEWQTNLALGLWQGVPGFTNVLGEGQPVLHAPAGPGPAFYRGKAWLH